MRHEHSFQPEYIVRTTSRRTGQPACGCRNCEVHLSDKVEHAIAYAVLSACTCFWLGRRRLIAGILVTVGYGALLEIVQALSGTGRTASFLDGGANLIGACLGAGMAWMVAKAASAR